MLVLFFSYKYIVDQLGIEQLGLWALLISIVSLSRITELGLTGSVVKYVSSHLANEDEDKAKSVIETVSISVAVLVATASLLAFIPVTYLIAYILEGEVTSNINQLLGLAFLSSFITSLSTVNKAGLDGCQRYDFSTIAVLASSIIFVIGILLLVPKFAINGLAYAYILQGITLVILSRIFLIKAIKALPLFPHEYSWSTFKELRSYGLRFQVISIVTILLEPLTKGMLAKFGNTEMVGFYELASKFVTQMRSLLVAMNQVLVPKVSESKAKGLLDVKTIYQKNYKLISFISVYFFTVLLCTVPIVEMLWLKNKSPEFEFFSIICISAYFINTLSIPAYMINTGTGYLRYNVISHILMGVINLILGIFLGMNFGGEGVVIAWGIAIAIGCIPIIIPFHKKYGISLTLLFQKTDFIGLLFGIVATLLAWYLYYNNIFNLNKLEIIGMFLLIILVLIVLPLWLNPTRKIISDRITILIKNKQQLK